MIDTCDTDMDIRDPGMPSLDGVCHFFRLPGELRNLVYEYVLTEPDGLFHRVDDKGVERLCLVSDDGAKPVSRQSEPLLLAQNPGSTPVLHKRRKISNEQRIETKEPDTENDKKKVIIVDDANQLRFVSRQLFRETRGLGIRFNDLTFRNSTREGAPWDTTITCMRFLKNCSAEHLRYLRNLTVDKARWENCVLGVGNALFHFCRKNPHITVNCCLSYLRQDSSKFMFHLMMVAYRTEKRPDLVSKLTGGNTRLEDYFSGMLAKFEKFPKEQMIANVRAFPWDRKFDADIFQMALQQDDRASRLIRRLSNEPHSVGIEGLMRIAKDVHDNGV
ncbi:hypothetical protein K504DRAFT_532166 [Pleomassaria siparia CBS 279.74]|uniref:Uncharacterized protein n=1 Tax=Pleomassaria siparia CBS 279.74 TaxID=1314801 RepID=A0A6G1KFP6_9PLEO|nr:hypothetical protein K504DRAFT_532166 [Pleomassaria siparia CBS 279.74]